MTPDELNDTLDAMQAAAAGNPELLPGLITVESSHWVQVMSAIKATCARLDDGLRHRNIRVAIGSQEKAGVLTRSEAGARGEPYRDLTE